MQKTLEYYLSLDYPVEIRRIEDSLGGGYVASIPSLGSYAFVGDGETPQEAYQDLQVAKKEIFEDWLEEGLPIPEPVDESEYEDYSGKLMLRMPRELHARLAAAAKRNHTSLNQYIVHCLGSLEVKLDVVQEIREIREMLSTAKRDAVVLCGSGVPETEIRGGVVQVIRPMRDSVTGTAAGKPTEVQVTTQPGHAA